MAIIAYQASHEQFKPSELLKYSCLAERSGFGAIHSSDHFKPWNEAQGQSGFSLAWLGAAMQATSIPTGFICAPGQRYHPAIIAQAIATLAEMFPQRLWVSLGSGEAMNEKITGAPWPPKAERNLRLLECFNIIRDMLDGKTVSHTGLVRVEQAKLYSLPEVIPKIFGAAVTAETAEWVGSWADGLLTVASPPALLKKVVDGFQRGGGRGKPMYLKVQLSYADSQEEAMQGAFEQWRTNIFPSAVLSELSEPSQFEAIAKFVRPDDVAKAVRVSNNLNQHLEWLQNDLELGFDSLILHNVNRQQETFIRAFGEKILPGLIN